MIFSEQIEYISRSCLLKRNRALTNVIICLAVTLKSYIAGATVFPGLLRRGHRFTDCKRFFLGGGDSKGKLPSS